MDRAILGFVEAAVGAPIRMEPHPTDRNLRVMTARGTYYLKRFRGARKLVQAREFLDEFAPRLAERIAVSPDGHLDPPPIPRVVAAAPELGALLLEGLPGTNADLDPRGRTERTFRTAGVLLRALHSLPVEDSDPVPIAAALEARAKALLERCGGEARAAARLALERLGGLDLKGARRVPCHRDFELRNWLIDARAAVRIVDFEHARLDHPVVDLVRLACFEWPGRPELESAFLEGYGGPCDEPVLVAISTLDTAATLAWAERHRDHEYAARGVRMLSAIEKRSERP
ncbi:MAG: aminoglycoside phosphotransferase family protein [Deltaproteobacteria bacterium]|nr:aminoglycoside phosphotransferase family protein [Deltaproteobacteria bacterium]